MSLDNGDNSEIQIKRLIPGSDSGPERSLMDVIVTHSTDPASGGTDVSVVERTRLDQLECFNQDFWGGDPSARIIEQCVRNFIFWPDTTANIRRTSGIRAKDCACRFDIISKRKQKHRPN